jgi:mannose/fructose/N-acetylgalactosamine-specific phosphotransferase system component IIC
MELWPVLVLLGGVVSTDTTAGPQIMISEPLVSCTLLGLLFGQPETGILLGVLFQLLWLGYLPLGAVRFTDHDMAAFIATASLLASVRLFSLGDDVTRAAILPAMLYGILIGSVGLRLNDLIRRRSGVFTERMIADIEDGRNTNIFFWHFRGVAATFLKGALMALIFVPAGVFVCGLVRYFPLAWIEALETGSFLILGAVCASALCFYWVQGKRRYLLFGSLGGVVWFIAALMR